MINPTTGKPVKRSTGWFGFNTIYRGSDGEKYMTRIWLGRLRLHVFHQPDTDPDPHDHPWDFWTFPLTSYVEEVTTKLPWNDGYETRLQVVPAFRWNFRPAEHCHRVLGRYIGITDPWGSTYNFPARKANDLASDRWRISYGRGKMVTILWRSAEYRRWGFLKHRDGKWCWQHWKEYVLAGGRSAPCDEG